MRRKTIEVFSKLCELEEQRSSRKLHDAQSELDQADLQLEAVGDRIDAFEEEVDHVQQRGTSAAYLALIDSARDRLREDLERAQTLVMQRQDAVADAIEDRRDAQRLAKRRDYCRDKLDTRERVALRRKQQRELDDMAVFFSSKSQRGGR